MGGQRQRLSIECVPVDVYTPSKSVRFTYQFSYTKP
jgi:hypothetical protein